MSSLIKHNRQQRALWIEREMQRVIDAKKAYVEGTATLEQLALLEQEKAGEEERRRKEELKKESYTYKARQWLFGGLKQEEATAADAAALETVNAERPRVLEALNAKRPEDSTTPQTPSSNAPLNEQTADAKQGGSKWSWTGWASGR